MVNEIANSRGHDLQSQVFDSMGSGEDSVLIYYEMLLEEIERTVEEYNEAGETVVVDNYAWVLQAGSFQNADDADQLRARLILMGLDTVTTEIEVNGVDWPGYAQVPRPCGRR